MLATQLCAKGEDTPAFCDTTMVKKSATEMMMIQFKAEYDRHECRVLWKSAEITLGKMFPDL